MSRFTGSYIKQSVSNHFMIQKKGYQKTTQFHGEKKVAISTWPKKVDTRQTKNTFQHNSLGTSKLTNINGIVNTQRSI